MSIKEFNNLIINVMLCIIVASYFLGIFYLVGTMLVDGYYSLQKPVTLLLQAIAQKPYASRLFVVFLWKTFLGMVVMLLSARLAGKELTIGIMHD